MTYGVIYSVVIKHPRNIVIDRAPNRLYDRGMKYVKIFRILATALLLALLIATLPSTPALAAGNLRVSPNSGKVGQEVEAWGSEFVQGRYDLYFSRESASEGEDIDADVLNYELVYQNFNVPSANFENKYFNVPARLTDGDVTETVRGGTYYVYATYTNSKNIEARVQFTVEAVALITLDPEEGPVGTEVKISGEGFGNRENITVEYNGSEVDIESGDNDTDSTGEFQNTKIIIPPSTAGTHTITVIGDVSNIEAEAEFTVEPDITITPESGAAGSTITVSGTGFGEDLDVTINFNVDEVATDGTNEDGSFEVSFPVPLRAEGSYTVEAVDDDDNSAEANFTIATTAVNIIPSTGKTGTEVTVNGNGFIASTSITITFADETVATTSSDADGNFSATFTVPNKATDTYKVKATDGTNTKEADFTISTSGDINPKAGSVGTGLTISDVGFTAGGTVTITYDGNQLATTTVNTDGSFSFNAPASSGGPHTIIATDETNTKQVSFTFIMESTPPLIPAPLKPEMNIKAKAEAYFDWEGVTDPSGVTYSLQIATDESFSPASIVLEKTGINSSEYTIPRAQRLKSVSKEAPYYWHVKAVDGAYNESQWSGTGSFYVGTSLALPQPVLYTLIGVGALLLVIFAFWLGRKTAYY